MSFSGGEVSGYTARASTVPDHNLVLMYACSTFAGGDDPPVSFRVYLPGATILNKAYTGFDAIVWSAIDTASGATVGLDSHSNKVLTDLMVASFIKEAVDAANLRYPPTTDFGVYVPMQIKGDAYARLVNVYMSQGEWSDTWRHSWYRVF